MKTILIALMLSCSVVGFAQNQTKQKRLMEEFTPEQQAILKTKKMVLDLDLSDSQKSQIMELNKKRTKEAAAKRTELKSLNKEEITAMDRFNMMNSALDAKISYQRELKGILNKDQYDRWKNSPDHMTLRSKHKMRSKLHKPRKEQKD